MNTLKAYRLYEFDSEVKYLLIRPATTEDDIPYGDLTIWCCATIASDCEDIPPVGKAWLKIRSSWTLSSVSCKLWNLNDTYEVFKDEGEADDPVGHILGLPVPGRN